MYNGVSPIRLLKPREMFRTIALTGFAVLVAATSISLAPPARAQIGNIFSDPAPRPPGSIPRGNTPSDDEEEVPELPRGRLLPSKTASPKGEGSGPKRVSARSVTAGRETAKEARCMPKARHRRFG